VAKSVVVTEGNLELNFRQYGQMEKAEVGIIREKRREEKESEEKVSLRRARHRGSRQQGFGVAGARGNLKR